MHRNKATFSTALLSEETLERFTTLFGVVSRRAVISWQEAHLSSADLIIVDSTLGAVQIDLPACTVFVGAPPLGVHTRGLKKRDFIISTDFTILQLLDTLDRVAVWLLEVRSQDTVKLQTAMNATSSTYRLRRWAVLPAQFSTLGYTRAMAMLTREAMTVVSLSKRSGLSEQQTRGLVEELVRQDALHIELTSRRDYRKASRPWSGTGGLIGKFASWLQHGRPLTGDR